VRASARRRLLLIETLVLSLVFTLVGRLFWVQMLDPNKPVQTAGAIHDGRIVLPAVRGEILDARGRVLVGNTSSYVITVNRSVLLAQPDHGVTILARLGALLGTPAKDLAQKITPCGVHVPNPCWTGQPYQPVPVAKSASTEALLAVSEHREDYPGVAVQTQTVRTYPGKTLAAHELGYVGQVSAADEKANASLSDADGIGRTGLEASYDLPLRGTDGYQVVKLDPRGNAVGDGRTVPATAGDTLVTSIDAGVQTLAENSLREQIAASRKAGYAAPGGAVVVMDPNTGRIIAAASYPTYDPEVFVGGISVADYQKLTRPSAGDPLLSKAIAGAYAPGSTFKLVSSSSDVMHKLASLKKSYSCPSALNIDGFIKHNFESEQIPGPVNLKLALQVSCDTWFYRFAVQEYHADQKRIAKGEQPHEYLQHMAQAYGFASSAQVDLPAGEQTVGSFADRANRLARWKQYRSQYCADAKHGYPDVKDRATRTFLTRLASENCTDGWRYRAGDNADLAIGQGETTVSPLQLAVAYSAMVNGGTVYKPTFAWAEVNPAGKVVRTVKPQVKNKLPVDKSVLAYIKDSLHFADGAPITGASAFVGSPIKTLLGGKTGTAEVYGKAATSWLATFGPTPKPKFVVVGMVEQAGTGASAAGPMVRRVWNGLLGVGGTPVLAGSSPASTLPKIVPNAVPKPLPSPGATSTKSSDQSSGARPTSRPASTPTSTSAPSPSTPSPSTPSPSTPRPSSSDPAVTPTSSRSSRSGGASTASTPRSGTSTASKTSTSKTTASKTTAARTNAPKTNAPKTNAPRTNAPRTTAPGTRASKTSAGRR
jgi:penicillin-binding protein 2